MSSVVRIGIIGCGRILNAHLRGLRLLQENGLGDGFRVTALCARQEIDLRRFNRRGEGLPPRPAPVDIPDDPLNAAQMYVSDLHPDSKTELYTDYRVMLAEGSVDAVCILTGHDNHHSIAIDALRAGKHVAVEKPMAITVKACQRMCEEADKAGRVLGVFESAHYYPITPASAWAVADGAIGDVSMVFQSLIGCPAPRPDVVLARTAWRQKKLGSGGGIAGDIGPHLFNRIRTIAGPIASVSALCSVLEPERVLLDEHNETVIGRFPNEVNDAFMANLVFESGAIGHVSFAISSHGVRLAFPGGTNVWGTCGALSGGEIVADDGATVSVMDYVQRNAPAETIDSWQPKGIGDAFALEQLDFVQAVRNGTQMRVSGEEGCLDMAISYATIESGLAGRSVTPGEILAGELCEYQQEINDHYGLG
ncbi:MAG: Gfo/Idh/MocA family oxidoreductase [Lentisphaerae bacterium]|jgi:1,5-anhydro-D-fructose reductase (1,5-anhydro-D-mannitol-forming)|nr:Gfo/Idh/MocA family oxidoreductase [Lentisphaerota bacterium]MBT4814162.1 Gfo/Idh/MocA family oxidoreductase [Lentisphaerota bacterium]MBT5609838.1 Gfo/Idh/MocA family oxidoreductase [Lentisphaerota bacterium]MBT7054389.1 Gfo/Idh/MocA family oxidoreductase [Lentisphaerota bacterium]MBT7846633.1 Gfo/Idh/MocA family oxidoreductase [Lentisphaerota bacterium]